MGSKVAHDCVTFRLVTNSDTGAMNFLACIHLARLLGVVVFARVASMSGPPSCQPNMMSWLVLQGFSKILGVSASVSCSRDSWSSVMVGCAADDADGGWNIWHQGSVQDPDENLRTFVNQFCATFSTL